jgi:hypothetical protein
MRRLLASLLLLLAPVAAHGQTPVVTSAAPGKVAVTLYRDPDRGNGEIDREAPSAFALISETRTVTLPPGVVTVRFEGVAGGIVPQSAILFGTEQRERNRDAGLLSQAGLVDAYTGQQVILRRTDPATGKTVEERAMIRSAADRLVVQTPRGIEAMYCSGLAQTLIYPDAPPSLSAKPVLTMTTRDQPGGEVTMTLAYIATGFDWDATYIGTLAGDGSALDLFAWLTMASGDETSFVDATTSAVAGRVNRSDDTQDDLGREAIERARFLSQTSQCWPRGTTSDGRPPPSVPVAAPAPMEMYMASGEIVVTGYRASLQAASLSKISVTAVTENLGDLKLYRIPVPVTVAARSQKQVAFLANRRIKGMLVYRSQVAWGDAEDPQLLFRFRNTKKAGLGAPVPGGKAILYQDSAWGRQLVGESSIADKTINEEVELVFGEAQNVTIESDDESIEGGSRYTVTVRNANPFPVHFEFEFANRPDRVVRGVSARLTVKPGKRVLAATLPANSARQFQYDTVDIDAP